MALRSVSLLLIVFVLVAAPSRAQKCKGMDVKYENEIQYPNSARAARVQGDVTLQIHIATDGTVTADILSGPPTLAESAKRFVESWTVSWPNDAPPTACTPVLRVAYKLKANTFNVKSKLPTHILVEAPPIETNVPAPRFHLNICSLKTSLSFPTISSLNRTSNVDILAPFRYPFVG